MSKLDQIKALREARYQSRVVTPNVTQAPPVTENVTPPVTRNVTCPQCKMYEAEIAALKAQLKKVPMTGAERVRKFRRKHDEAR